MTAPAPPIDPSVSPAAGDVPAHLSFPVVGIGASAGGIEAFGEFLAHMPPDSGMAFVFVQHLAPDRESKVAEVLGRQTQMRVLQVSEGMPLQPDTVYVIRPGRTMTLSHGHLHLGEPVEKRGHQRPVDDFFRSLASEQRERAIAIILSGMGSNGTVGAQVVKANGGVCIAQTPDSAKFPSMPRQMIDSGCADFVLSPEEIPAILLNYARHSYVRGAVNPERMEPADLEALGDILLTIKKRLRHDFAGYKKATIIRRVERRMGLRQIEEMRAYATVVASDPAELGALTDDLMIHVTAFFRDPEAWGVLRSEVIVPLVAGLKPGKPIRAWVTACSSGEEAYTLAMLLVEAVDAVDGPVEIKIFATDTAPHSLAYARAGLYAGGIESEISPERLERFFDREDTVYRIKKGIRDLVVFAPQNALQDPPFSKLDICTCRNLLIYLEPEAQRRLLALLHFGLREGGTLMLGTSETVTQLDHLFSPIDKKHRLFRRQGSGRRIEVDFPMMQTGRGNAILTEAPLPGAPSIPHMTQRALLDRYSPPAVVVDRNLHILYYHGATERFLLQPRGEPTRDLLALARENVRGIVRLSMQRALEENATVRLRDTAVESADGRTRLEITVTPLERRPIPALFLLAFGEYREPAQVAVPDAQPGDQTVMALQEEILKLREELLNSSHELQSNSEEMKASNEEATSINEEMQSTNEELETSKEELQSLNEELSTVNSQLQSKMGELETTTSDLASLLSSTDIAVVFLDRQFRIRRFTPAVNDLFVLIPTDVGRPLSDLARKFHDAALMADARTVLEKLVPLEREVVSETGRTYLRRVLPYRSSESRIDGVVITFVDISELQVAQSAVRQGEERHRLILEGVEDHAIFMLDPTGQIASWSRAAERMLGYSESEAVGRPVASLYGPDETPGDTSKPLLAPTVEGAPPIESWYLRKDERRFWGSSSLSALRKPDGGLVGYVKVIRDDSARKEVEETLKQAKFAAETANTSKDRFLATVSHELRTPLASILLWSELLADMEEIDAPLLKEAMAAIRVGAIEQRDLIEDLVETSRIVAGKLTLDIKPLDLPDTLRAGVESGRAAAIEKQVTLSLTVDPAVSTVLADAGRLKQVVSNLVGNAIKFTPPGGRIKVEAHRHNSHVLISVADSGQGIPDEALAQIFAPFVQLQDPGTRKQGGLGLGLAIVRQIVETHGGTVVARSAGPTQGSTFTVSLPLPHIAPAEPVSIIERKRLLSRELAGRHVLVVEDVAATARALTAVLEQAGAQVRSAETSAAALEAYGLSPPDLIISDLGLPDVSGYELISLIRQREQHSGSARVPAIAFTAFAGDNVQQKALGSGFDLCLTKPMDPLALVAALLRLLRPRGQ